ncbi:GTPase HflX [Roseomonas genomospecies 6]|uniref:GTPase HflX n=1 Tax=Roseomonas genomospecies 6 TaxID=214106 RepID=A0A9W7NGA4_9PROT|nr:GTPase HflX [Roseomonas genomospecies 6]KAA0675847.1 GTPase HflX [Roseomonas genomospecies 6]
MPDPDDRPSPRSTASASRSTPGIHAEGAGPPSAGRALVFLPLLPTATDHGDTTARQPDARLAEAIALAQAIHLEVPHAEVIRIARPDPATLFGRGTAERIGGMVEAFHADLVVIDHALSPVQQRNLERQCMVKVIDRTGLILEIFGERARTREGQLQVELAALTYQRSRLVRSWTHLERQRGGFGFLGGPGESQLELDRRLIAERIARLKTDLEEVRRTRKLHRSARQRGGTPLVALVGYTNAGKSTLFNRLSGAGVTAEDMLFATLDPTVRRIVLSSGKTIALSDTVGFVSELPTQLVAAFRATLEEVQAADLILHVRDVSHPDSAAQKADVESVLADLGIDAANDPRVVEVLNKTDQMPATARGALHMRLANQRMLDGDERAVAVSALTGEGLDELMELLDRRMSAGRRVLELSVNLSDGRALAWLYEHGQVLDRRDADGQAHLHVALAPADAARFESRFAGQESP